MAFISLLNMFEILNSRIEGNKINVTKIYNK